MGESYKAGKKERPEVTLLFSFDLPEIDVSEQN
jgi:hypothetical protein